MSSTSPKRLIVAIDGPAGSGKSTTARAVAEALGYAHLDSGALYRAVTLVALDAGERPPRWNGGALAGLARERGVALERRESRGGGGGGGAYEVTIGGAPAGAALRSETVTRNVSAVSALPEVRDFVNERLRAAARDGGVVLEGRDIGTVVFPDAAVKVFLVAEPAERARRRLVERGRAVERESLEDETQALLTRDALDSSRPVAPLVRASDAVLLDTTQLSFEAQVRAVVDLAHRAEDSLDRAGGRG